VQKLDTRGNPDEGRSAPLQQTSASVLAAHDDSMSTASDDFESTTADSTGPTSVSLTEAKAKKGKWVKHSLALVEKEELARDDAIAWAACHALQQAPSEDPPALCALPPLFYETATPAWLSMERRFRGKPLSISTLGRYKLPILTSLSLPLPSTSSESGQISMVSQCMLSCWVDCTPKWYSRVH